MREGRAEDGFAAGADTDMDANVAGKSADTADGTRGARSAFLNVFHVERLYDSRC